MDDFLAPASLLPVHTPTSSVKENVVRHNAFVADADEPGAMKAPAQSWMPASPLSIQQAQESVAEYLEKVRLPPWLAPPTRRLTRLRLLQLLFAVLLVAAVSYFQTARRALSTDAVAAAVSPSVFPDLAPLLGANSTKRLPHIPPKIWQIYLAFSPHEVARTQLTSWITNSPSHAYTVLDAEGALSVVAKLAAVPGRAHVLPLFYAMSRRVLRADFLRYLVLAIEGGVYSDMDTQLVRPVHAWVPDEFRSRARLIVGLEADASPPVAGTTHEVQFCQWTLAGAAGHPTFWAMVDRILARVRDRPFESPPRDVDYSDEDVLDVTGPAGWTEVVYAHLSEVTGTVVTWRNLTGMREPRLYGDTLVLPIDGFATGVPHSNASKVNTAGTMVKHLFAGAWRDGNG